MRSNLQCNFWCTTAETVESCPRGHIVASTLEGYEVLQPVFGQGHSRPRSILATRTWSFRKPLTGGQQWTQLIGEPVDRRGECDGAHGMRESVAAHLRRAVEYPAPPVRDEKWLGTVPPVNIQCEGAAPLPGKLGPVCCDSCSQTEKKCKDEKIASQATNHSDTKKLAAYKRPCSKSKHCDLRKLKSIKETDKENKHKNHKDKIDDEILKRRDHIIAESYRKYMWKKLNLQSTRTKDVKQGGNPKVKRPDKMNSNRELDELVKSIRIKPVKPNPPTKVCATKKDKKKSTKTKEKSKRVEDKNTKCQTKAKSYLKNECCQTIKTMNMRTKSCQTPVCKRSKYEGVTDTTISLSETHIRPLKHARTVCPKCKTKVRKELPKGRTVHKTTSTGISLIGSKPKNSNVAVVKKPKMKGCGSYDTKQNGVQDEIHTTSHGQHEVVEDSSSYEAKGIENSKHRSKMKKGVDGVITDYCECERNTRNKQTPNRSRRRKSRMKGCGAFYETKECTHHIEQQTTRERENDIRDKELIIIADAEEIPEDEESNSSSNNCQCKQRSNSTHSGNSAQCSGSEDSTTSKQHSDQSCQSTASQDRAEVHSTSDVSVCMCNHLKQNGNPERSKFQMRENSLVERVLVDTKRDSVKQTTGVEKTSGRDICKRKRLKSNVCPQNSKNISNNEIENAKKGVYNVAWNLNERIQSIITKTKAYTKLSTSLDGDKRASKVDAKKSVNKEEGKGLNLRIEHRPDPAQSCIVVREKYGQGVIIRDKTGEISEELCANESVPLHGRELTRSEVKVIVDNICQVNDSDKTNVVIDCTSGDANKMNATLEKEKGVTRSEVKIIDNNFQGNETNKTGILDNVSQDTDKTNVILRKEKTDTSINKTNSKLRKAHTDNTADVKITLSFDETEDDRPETSNTLRAEPVPSSVSLVNQLILREQKRKKLKLRKRKLQVSSSKQGTSQGNIRAGIKSVAKKSRIKFDRSFFDLPKSNSVQKFDRSFFDLSDDSLESRASLKHLPHNASSDRMRKTKSESLWKNAGNTVKTNYSNTVKVTKTVFNSGYETPNSQEVIPTLHSQTQKTSKMKSGDTMQQMGNSLRVQVEMIHEMNLRKRQTLDMIGKTIDNVFKMMGGLSGSQVSNVHSNGDMGAITNEKTTEPYTNNAINTDVNHLPGETVSHTLTVTNRNIVLIHETNEYIDNATTKTSIDKVRAPDFVENTSYSKKIDNKRDGRKVTLKESFTQCDKIVRSQESICTQTEESIANTKDKLTDINTKLNKPSHIAKNIDMKDSAIQIKNVLELRRDVIAQIKENIKINAKTSSDRLLELTDGVKHCDANTLDKREEIKDATELNDNESNSLDTRLSEPKTIKSLRIGFKELDSDTKEKVGNAQARSLVAEVQTLKSKEIVKLMKEKYEISGEIVKIMKDKFEKKMGVPGKSDKM